MRPVYCAAARRTPIGRLRGARSTVRPDTMGTGPDPARTGTAVVDRG
ncbi:hypothetical protein ACFV80_37440 [Streptomyces sp. NPDC059862]